MMRITLAILLLIPSLVRADDEVLMQEFELNGLELSGAEYWPYHGSEPINYPDDILWGFYPEEGVIPYPEGDPNPASASPEAIACAELAFTALQAFFAAPPPLLHHIIAHGEEHFITNKFYLWVNDYSNADQPYPHTMRPNRFWYWTRNPQVEGRTPGFWKWESTLTQDGECLLPERDQIQEYIEEKWRQIR